MTLGDSREITSRLVGALTETHPARLGIAVDQVLSTRGGVEKVTVWVADMGYSKLRQLIGAETVEMVGTMAGRCFTTKEVVAAENGIFAPIDSVGRTVGVLELRGPGTSGMLDELPQITTVIADRLIASRNQSDVVEIRRGAGDLDIAATIQHELMPIPSFADDQMGIGGQIEPAYEIAGDAFDYAVNDGHAFFGVFDAVGHGLRSALLTTVAVGTFRLHRRRQDGLADIAAAIEAAVCDVSRGSEFVTGVIGRVGFGDNVLELANAGHLPPVLIRDGHSHTMGVPAVVPYGINRMTPELFTQSLQAGDAIYCFSDGIIEAYDKARVPFGSEALFAILEQSERDGSPVQRVCKDVLAAVVEHVGGRPHDDATILGIRIN